MAPKAAAKDEKKKVEVYKPRLSPEDHARKLELDKKLKELPHLKQPDRAAFDEKVEKINADISKFQAQLQEFNNKINAKTGGKDEFYTQKEALWAKVKAQQDVIDKYMERKEEIFQAIKSKQDKGREARSELNTMKKKIGFESEEQIDARIAEIEYEMYTSSMNLKKEKDLMKEIAALKQTKPMVSQYAKLEMGAGTLNATDVGPLKAQQQAVMEAINVARDAKRAASAEYGALMDARKKIMLDMPELFEERDTLNKSIGDMIRKRNAMRDEFRQTEREYNNSLYEQRQIRQEKSKLERQERQLEYDEHQKERKKERLEDMAQDVPFQAEIQLIEQTMAYLNSLLPKKAEEKVKEEKAVDFNNPSGSMVMMSKKERDSEMFFAPTKKKNLKQSRSGGDKKRIQHLLGSLQLFEQLKVKAPYSVDDVPPILEDLEGKMGEWKGKQEKAVVERKAKLEALERGEVEEEETAAAAE